MYIFFSHKMSLTLLDTLNVFFHNRQIKLSTFENNKICKKRKTLHKVIYNKNCDKPFSKIFKFNTRNNFQNLNYRFYYIKTGENIRQ